MRGIEAWPSAVEPENKKSKAGEGVRRAWRRWRRINVIDGI